MVTFSHRQPLPFFDMGVYMIGIGIDTGGTYTDAVIYDTIGHKVFSSAKALTTKENLEIGIANALDHCDQDMIKKAEMMALSTTLATNAALEDTGSRAKALMIGMRPDKMLNLKKVYASYGLHDLSQIVFIDGEPEGFGENPTPPDWKALEEHAEEWFGDCRAVGITQVFPNMDNAKLEKTAKRILRDKLGIPVTCASEMFNETDVLKRGAGTLLNARLIPIIEDFLAAVKDVQKARGMDIPVAIVRSDGSLMTEEMAREYPVETLLSGPAASTIGGSVLAGEKDAIVVDMGGTTTDISAIRHGSPISAENGIQIGRWKTTVRGLYVHTFLLGGDSAVRFNREKLFLDGKRVLPLSLLADSFPRVTERLEKLASLHRHHTRMLHEFFVQQRPMAGEETYTGLERKIYHALDDGPLQMDQMAETLGTDIYHLDTGRLEEEGLIIRSGLTPTDIMMIKGDFAGYPTEAAEYAISFISENVAEAADEIPDAVYDMVMRKMYHGIVGILLEQKYPKEHRMLAGKEIGRLIDHMYEEARASLEGREPEWAGFGMMTHIPLVGVGAPTHIFLEKVAKMLGTRAIIRENSPVANALGAIASQIITRLEVHVKAQYKGAELEGFSVFDENGKHLFESYEEAEQFGLDYARRQVLEKARKQGASGDPSVELKIRQIRADAGKASMLFEAIIEATATDIFRI